MRDKYKELYIEAIKQYKDIEADIINIEQGIKEKPCFKPIIDTIHLDVLLEMSKLYITQLKRVIDFIEESEG